MSEGGGEEEEVCKIYKKHFNSSIAILSHHVDWLTLTPRVYLLNVPPSRLDVCDTSGSILPRLGLDDRGSDSAKSNKKPLGAAALWRLRYYVPSKGYSPMTQWRCVMYLRTDSSETAKLTGIAKALKQDGWILSKLYRSHVIGHGVLDRHVQPAQCQMGERL
jgi:hypothetical protein